MASDNEYQCWHGTLVKPDASGWVHVHSESRCDDPNPMRKPEKGWGKKK